MLSSKRVDEIQEVINGLKQSLLSQYSGNGFDNVALAYRLFSKEIPQIEDCYDECIHYSGTLNRNIEIIAKLLEDYILREQEVDNIYNSTIKVLSPYKGALNSYNNALLKYQSGIFNRNILDDMRLSLELLVKELFSLNKTLEHCKNEIGKVLKEKGTSDSIRNLFTTILSYYTQYNNDSVKHNDMVQKSDVEFIMEQTSIMMKYLIEKCNK